MSCFSCCLSEDKVNRRSLRKSIQEGRDARTIASSFASSFANLSFKSGIFHMLLFLLMRSMCLYQCIQYVFQYVLHHACLCRPRHIHTKLAVYIYGYRFKGYNVKYIVLIMLCVEKNGI